VTGFDGIIGHRHVLGLLSAELDNPAQAYLFVGPGSVGKSAVARQFAAALLCGDDSGCADRARRGIHPDLMLIEPEGRASITVDQARHVVSVASLAPLEANRRIFLFEEGGMMNDEAANALLKTLEEPSSAAIFIIVAESEDELPDTVASRCRTVVFGRVGEEAVAAGLVQLGVEEDQAEQASRISGGRPGLALALATRPEVADFRRAWLSIPMRLPEHPGDAFRLADEVLAAVDPLLTAVKERHQDVLDAGGDDGSTTRVTKERQARELRRATDALHVTGLEILASFYRDVAAAQFGAGVRNSDVPVTSFTRIAPAVALRHAEKALATVEALRANQRPQLAFATLFADLGFDG
jgi:DNA polymerase-3 subunit delta'